MTRQHRQWGACYQYRLMSPLGVYPEFDIDVDGATLYSSDKLVAIVATENFERTELLLKAAILLSSPEASGNIRFYTFPYIHQLDSKHTGSANLESILKDIQQKRTELYTPAGATIPEFDWYENAKGASLPPVLGGASYNWTKVSVDVAVVRELFNRLKQQACSKTQMALAGLIESNQLSCHFQFQKQAVALMLDCLRLIQETESFQTDSAQLAGLLSQLGDSAEDYLISRQQMAQKVGPKDFHRLFVQSCTQLRKFLMNL